MKRTDFLMAGIVIGLAWGAKKLIVDGADWLFSPRPIKFEIEWK